MRAVLLGGVAVAALAAISPVNAADASAVSCDPYKNYSCLDAYLGDDIWSRLVNYYKLEWGRDGPPNDPKAPPSRRRYWPGTPETVPPQPFTEWPYGGTTTLGVTRPNSADSPLMVALAKTEVGEFMADHNVQVYGWVNGGFNISTSKNQGGNNPAAYIVNPNTLQLDQFVVYMERLPDTVQNDHIDWGFRLSGIYGENYRYTNSYGLWSDQFNGHNQTNGFDAPMMYGELFFPQVAEGLVLRFGRYIALPDIEAQLAPNNYMYSHSLTYTFDNYTNTGIQGTLGLTKNWFLQLGVSVGTEAMPWHWGETSPNFFPNPVFPGGSYLTDPGAKPSVTACVRWQNDSGNDNVYACGDALNDGVQGYNNLQWTGITYYHKFNDQWHISMESYLLSQKNVLNAGDLLQAGNPQAIAILNNGGSPFSPQNIAFNSPGTALCSNPAALTCTARAYSALAYLNYSPNPLDNWSARAEYYDDEEGQRTGVATRYIEFGIGLQHWLSPQIELRPEVTWYRSLNAPAFDANLNPFTPAPPTKYYAVVGASDIIWHF
jgi:hypothetical protein